MKYPLAILSLSNVFAPSMSLGPCDAAQTCVMQASCVSCVSSYPGCEGVCGSSMISNGISNFGNGAMYPNNVPYGAQNGMPYGAQNGIPYGAQNAISYGGNGYNQYPNNVRTTPIRYNAASAANICITSIALILGMTAYIV
uniref:SSP7 n=1 Tax=Albugo laibachii Nc14 TaxID=890382 RepID=F0WYL4_9STRA|nr:SSP7 [Albugo laibachii Nc14]CCA26879.1 SSP7 [Albugo laibachii Nc14]|eukprot:CCA26879.1 SSP7 [Albugo laibachii Nc14]